MDKFKIGDKVLYTKHKKDIHVDLWDLFIGKIFTISSFCRCEVCAKQNNREIGLREIGEYYTDEEGIIKITKLGLLLYLEYKNYG
jgi:hypothetical protein